MTTSTKTTSLLSITLRRHIYSVKKLAENNPSIEEIQKNLEWLFFEIEEDERTYKKRDYNYFSLRHAFYYLSHLMSEEDFNLIYNASLLSREEFLDTFLRLSYMDKWY